MKKYLLLIAAGMLFLGTNAQSLAEAGVHAKVSGSQFNRATTNYETKLKPGFELGAFARFEMSNVFYFQPELNFGYIGGKIKPDGLREVEYKSAAFNLPILLGVKVVDAGDAKFRIYIGLGNTISVLNSIKIRNQTISEINSNRSMSIPSDDLKSSLYELSGIAGLSFDIMDVTVDLRYSRGINQAVTIKTIDGSHKFYQNTFTLALGYKMLKP